MSRRSPSARRRPKASAGGRSSCGCGACGCGCEEQMPIMKGRRGNRATRRRQHWPTDAIFTAAAQQMGKPVQNRTRRHARRGDHEISRSPVIPPRIDRRVAGIAQQGYRGARPSPATARYSSSWRIHELPAPKSPARCRAFSFAALRCCCGCPSGQPRQSGRPRAPQMGESRNA